jgi:hypothetical protein
MYQQQHYPNPHPQRTAIPKVIGILMIIFASLGLLGGLLGLAGGGNQELFREVPGYKTWRTIELLLTVVGLAMGALHLYAGVRALGYKANAPGLCKAYAIVAMAMVVLNVILVFAWVKPMMEKAMGDMGGMGSSFGTAFGGIMIFMSLLGLAWPLIVLILMSRPSVKAACVNEL